MSAYPVRKTGYKRKYSGPYRGRTYVQPGRWATYGGAAKQLMNDVMYLKTLINSEPHHHYVGASNNFNYNGTIVSLSSVPQGDTTYTRTGNRVLPRYLNVRWQLTSGTGNSMIRVMLFRYWGEAPTAAPNVNVNEVLRVYGVERAPLSHLNDDITGQKGDRNRRIEVLRSELVNVDQVERRAQTGEWDVEVNGKYVDKKEHIEWRSGTTEEALSGGFYMLFIGHSATDDAYSLESKLTFYDN